MLDVHHQEQVKALLAKMKCEVELPEEWRDSFFEETGVANAHYNDRRRFVRHKFRSEAILDVAKSLPHIERKTDRCAVYTVDISRGGFAFLHTQQLFPSERCRLWLPTQSIILEVCRCRRYNERCYLIGARPLKESEA